MMQVENADVSRGSRTLHLLDGPLTRHTAHIQGRERRMHDAALASNTGPTTGGRCQDEKAELQFLEFFASNILKPEYITSRCACCRRSSRHAAARFVLVDEITTMLLIRGRKDR